MNENAPLSAEDVKIVDTKAKAINLEPGTYYYCRCGRSADGIFCDGAHKGTAFVPKKFTVEEPKTVYICLCKHTKTSPFCDGSHKSLPK